MPHLGRRRFLSLIGQVGAGALIGGSGASAAFAQGAADPLAGRPMARYPEKTDLDPAHLAPAPARDADVVLRPRHHSQRRLLRPLPRLPGADERGHRHVAAQGPRQGRQAARALAQRPQDQVPGGQAHRRRPVRGQRPRALLAARARRPVGKRRDGQRRVGRRPAARRPRARRRPAGRRRRHLRRPRQARLPHRPRLREEPGRGPDHGRSRRDRGVPDERPAAADAERLSRAAHRAGLVRDLLGQEPRRDRGDRPRVRQLLDEVGLPHPRQRVRLRRAGRRRPSTRCRSPR